MTARLERDERPNSLVFPTILHLHHHLLSFFLFFFFGIRNTSSLISGFTHLFIWKNTLRVFFCGEALEGKEMVVDACWHSVQRSRKAKVEAKGSDLGIMKGGK